MSDTTTIEREYRRVDDIATIRERNAAVRELEAEGFTVTAGGSKRYGYRVTGWKGEPPAMVREVFSLRHGTHEVTPMYRRADGRGFEYADGTPERDD